MRSFFLVCVCASSVCGIEPTIRDVSVRGLQIGGTTTIVVDASDLGTAPKLLFPFPVKQTLKKGTASQAIFEVTLDANVPAGFANLHVATDEGVSVPVVVALDRFKQHTLAQAITELPAACTGTLLNAYGSYVAIPGKAGQRVMVEVEAQRLGSKLRPVLHVTDKNKKQVAWSWGTPALQGDTRLEFTPKEDGEYVLQIHDAEYTVPNPNFYRVKIGVWQHVDQIFPPILGKEARSVELLGSSSHTVNVPLGKVQPLPWPNAGVWSGPRPFVERSTRMEVVEQSGGNVQELPVGIRGVSGKLSAPFEEDVYRVPVVPGKMKLEVFAERLGSPLDVALVVRNEMGADVARAEDGPNTLDPVLEYTVPEKVTFVRVAVQDASGRGSARGIYRLVVTPANTPPANDFALFTPTRRIPFAGVGVIPIFVDRRGYEGPITIFGTGLPPGVVLSNAIIPDRAQGTLLVVNAPVASHTVITAFHGVASDSQERPVMVQGHPLTELQPWLATELPCVTPAKATDFSVTWRGLPANTVLTPVMKLSLPVQVKRLGDGTIRLTLLTSQNPPLNNRQPDPNRTIRMEKPVELAAKVTEGVVDVLVPAELTAPSYDVCVQAEFLTPDKGRVLATAFTPVQRLAVRQPFTIAVTNAVVSANRDAKNGFTADIVGTITRFGDFKGEVTIAITGLPPGARLAPTTIKADATQFRAQLIFAPTQAPGDVRGLQLFGSAAPDPKQPNIRVKSADTMVVVAIPPPPMPAKK